jgi:glyoxylase-like metal-dependent hydrolase (beta-lactamase superfamily II)
MTPMRVNIVGPPRVATRIRASVPDPVGDIEPYLRAAEAAGMRIHFVIDTHVHADHLSAGRQVAKASGAEYVLGSRAEVSFPRSGRVGRSGFDL